MTSIEQTGINITVAADNSTSKTPNVEGNNDQWKRHLEKAYFERQADAMETADSPKGAEQVQTVRKSDLVPLPISDSVDTDQELASADFENMQTLSHMHAPNILSTTRQLVGLNAYRSQPSDAWLSASSAAQTRHGAQRPDTSLVSSSVLKLSASVWRDTFPTTSSISTLKSESGVHLVIRDSSLSSVKVRQLVGKLQQLLRAEGHELTAVTLNGSLMWDSVDSYRSEYNVPGSRTQHR